MGNKRLLWITSLNQRPWQTGGEKYIARVIGYLRQKGWEVIIPSVPGDVDGGILKRHLISNIQLFRILLPLTRLGELVVEDTYWHSRLLLFNLLGRLLKSVRIVVTCHHAIYRDFGPGTLRRVVKLTEGLFLRTVDRVVAVSENTRQEVTALGVPISRVSLVPDGFDRPPQSHSGKGKDSQLRLLFVGACYPRKGVEYLLRAMHHLGDRRAILDLVGDLVDDVYYAHRMQALAKELGLAEAVIFHGRVSEERLWELYAGADIFVLPSIWEGFGIVLLEAMSFGLPIVATRVGAIPELVVHEENGLLVPPADSYALAEALARLTNDAALREQLGENGRARCEQSLTWEEVGERFAIVLEQVLLAK